MIQLQNIHKRYGDYVALDDVSLSVAPGELVALLGPSGSGKTTLLRILAGLEAADAGRVLLNGGDVTALSARERQVGFVFQHYALFRHMTVFDNVAFGLTVRPRRQRPGKAEIAERVHHLLAMVQLEGLAGRVPSQLSGGQRQRVALARALAIEPRLLLLDEPFGALDAKVRKDLRRWLRRLHDELGMTGVFVTHDQEEALEVADRVVVMSRGRIEQVGSPAEIYDHPATPFVYQFLGNVNRLDCRLRDGRAEMAGLSLEAPGHGGVGEVTGQAFIRPHDLELLPAEAAEGAAAVVSHVSLRGGMARAELMLAGRILEAELPRPQAEALALRAGAAVRVRPRQARFFLENGWSGAEPAVAPGYLGDGI